MSQNNILERVVIHANKTFIHQGETRTDAFMIQDGEVASFVVEKGNKVEIDRYKSGTIIAEMNLLTEEVSKLNFEATVNTTLVKITRQDFEKKLKKHDAVILNVITHLIEKLKKQEHNWAQHILQAKQNDFKAMEIVDHLLRDMEIQRKRKYEEVLLPHFNIMVKALEEIKRDERHEKQKTNLDNTIERVKSDADEEKE